MNTSLRDSLLGLLFGLTSAPLVFASTPVATLTCQTAQGSKLTTQVYQFQVADAEYPDGNFSVDISAFAPLLAAQSRTPSYANCVLDVAGSSVTLSNVAVSNVNAAGIAQGFASTELPMVLPALSASQLFATANLAYSALTFDGVSKQAAAARPAKSGEKASASYDTAALARFRSKVLRGIQSESLGAQIARGH